MANPQTTHVIEIETGIGEPAFIPLSMGQRAPADQRRQEGHVAHRVAARARRARVRLLRRDVALLAERGRAERRERRRLSRRQGVDRIACTMQDRDRQRAAALSVSARGRGQPADDDGAVASRAGGARRSRQSRRPGRTSRGSSRGVRLEPGGRRPQPPAARLLPRSRSRRQSVRSSRASSRRRPIRTSPRASLRSMRPAAVASRRARTRGRPRGNPRERAVDPSRGRTRDARTDAAPFRRSASPFDGMGMQGHAE